MAPAAAWSRSRSSPGRISKDPLTPSSMKRSSGSQPSPSSRMRRSTSSSWLAIVSSWACRSEETLA